MIFARHCDGIEAVGHGESLAARHLPLRVNEQD